MKSLQKEDNVIIHRFYKVVGVIFLIFFFRYLMQPMFVVETETAIIKSLQAAPGLSFNTRFIHSVQKTPVEEFFVINDKCNGFILHSTKYHSFGVGLPFLASDGNFRYEGNDFIMDDMERKIKILELRTGVDTKLALSVADETILLYQLVPIGSLIRISIMPRYKMFVR